MRGVELVSHILQFLIICCGCEICELCLFGPVHKWRWVKRCDIAEKVRWFLCLWPNGCSLHIWLLITKSALLCFLDEKRCCVFDKNSEKSAKHRFVEGGDPHQRERICLWSGNQRVEKIFTEKRHILFDELSSRKEGQATNVCAP